MDASMSKRGRVRRNVTVLVSAVALTCGTVAVPQSAVAFAPWDSVRAQANPDGEKAKLDVTVDIQTRDGKPLDTVKAGQEFQYVVTYRAEAPHPLDPDVDGVQPGRSDIFAAPDGSTLSLSFTAEEGTQVDWDGAEVEARPSLAHRVTTDELTSTYNFRQIGGGHVGPTSEITLVIPARMPDNLAAYPAYTAKGEVNGVAGIDPQSHMVEVFEDPRPTRIDNCSSRYTNVQKFDGNGYGTWLAEIDFGFAAGTADKNRTVGRPTFQFFDRDPVNADGTINDSAGQIPAITGGIKGYDNDFDGVPLQAHQQNMTAEQWSERNDAVLKSSLAWNFDLESGVGDTWLPDGTYVVTHQTVEDTECRANPVQYLARPGETSSRVHVGHSSPVRLTQATASDHLKAAVEEDAPSAPITTTVIKEVPTTVTELTTVQVTTTVQAPNVSPERPTPETVTATTTETATQTATVSATETATVSQVATKTQTETQTATQTQTRTQTATQTQTRTQTATETQTQTATQTQTQTATQTQTQTATQTLTQTATQTQTQTQTVTEAARVETEASIGSRVWRDNNHNGKRDERERGIPNVVVIVGREGEVTRMASTGANGEWSIDGLTQGAEYSVRYLVPENWEVTGAVPNAVDDRGLAATIRAGSNDAFGAADLGLFTNAEVADKVGTAGGFIWRETDAQGRKIGYPGVEVRLTTELDEPDRVTHTDDSGAWYITGLTPGVDYVVEFSLPEGIEPSVLPPGSTFKDGKIRQDITVSEDSPVQIGDSFEIVPQKPAPTVTATATATVTQTVTATPDPAPGATSEGLERCWANAKQSPFLYLLPVGLLVGLGIAAAPSIPGVDAQIARFNAELNGQIAAANPQLQSLLADPNVQAMGAAAAGLIALAAAGGVLYDWCSSEAGKAVTASSKSDRLTTTTVTPTPTTT